jgi:phosphoribosylformylglycinamidine cyclo-ligase
MPDTPAGLSYRDAGVDRDLAARAKRRIGELIAATHNANVVGGPGGFGALFRVPSGLASPVLVSSADGVGTKLKVGMRANRHDTVGVDLVNHCVNDILVEGAAPLFFLDYIGMGRLEAGTVEQIVEGLATGCRENGCALIGGETAELPDFYAPGEYDLAGFIVGIVDEAKRLGQHRVQRGDVLLGVAASGFHTNGYSLLRRLFFERLKLDVDDPFPGSSESVGDVLLRPHRSYLAALRPLLERLHAMAHITGGGVPENLERVIPAGLSARVERSAWELPAEFRTVQELGGVSDEEMLYTFNCGLGMILVVPPDHADDVASRLQRQELGGWRLGEVVPGAELVVVA